MRDLLAAREHTVTELTATLLPRLLDGPQRHWAVAEILADLGDIITSADHPSTIVEDRTANAAQAVAGIRDRVLPHGSDPRTCPACAVGRWLDILGILDGLGRGSARMHLAAASAPTARSPHQHTLIDPPRWRYAAHLLPAIDRHGWIDDYQPLSTRSIHTRLTRAAHRAAIHTSMPDAPSNTPDPRRKARFGYLKSRGGPHPPRPGRRRRRRGQPPHPSPPRRRHLA